MGKRAGKRKSAKKRSTQADENGSPSPVSESGSTTTATTTTTTTAQSTGPVEQTLIKEVEVKPSPLKQTEPVTKSTKEGEKAAEKQDQARPNQVTINNATNNAIHQPTEPTIANANANATSAVATAAASKAKQADAQPVASAPAVTVGDGQQLVTGADSAPNDPYKCMCLIQ